MAFRYPGSSISSFNGHHSSSYGGSTHGTYPTTHSSYPSTSSLSSSPGGYSTRGTTKIAPRPDSFSSGYGSDYNSPGYVSPILSPTFKIVAKNTAPLMALQGKSVVEVDHKIRVRERADHFVFQDTADQIEGMVRRQEENLLRFANKQIRDTGQVYHVQESNEMEFDMDETAV